MLEKVNHSTIAKLLYGSMVSLLWPNGIRHDDVLLFVSDAVVHITCLAHGLHWVAEEIHNMFPKVDKLISNVKKTFLKAPYRV
ncbi:DUF659 domain-containing protein [Aphis craccivora]|uniref:DUF659 domain-containing protein n=1 Tax=Aphis craccivora TaxID=307492 RepID=A0A6G0VU34_APHCR|nr:DUF659 domain-containing protein [Aphis craccivora]